jgi:hypothetical protein
VDVDVAELLEQQSTTVQTLIFAKAQFRGADAAKKWAADHGFKGGKVDETEDGFRLRQREPGEFKEGSFRTIMLKPGVKAVIGKLKSTKESHDVKPAHIEETYAQGEVLREAQIDREGSRIANVKLLGAVSKNGRRYSSQALDDAKVLFEGARFFLDHPTEQELRATQGVRSVKDLAGKVIGVRRIGEEVRGDLQILNREPTKSLIFSLAEQMPELVGNSWRGDGKVRQENGTQIVEGLTKVHAIELVTEPATATTLFESVDNDGSTQMKDVTIEKLKTERPDLVQSLHEQFEAERKGSDETEQLKKDNKALKEENDQFKVKQQEGERDTMIADKLKTAKLPDRVVTDTFRTQLKEAKDEAAIDALIADRKALVSPTGPKSTERQITEGDQKPIAEASLEGSGLRTVAA